VPILPRLPRSRRTQTPEMPKPTGEVGHEHPAEGRGNSDWTSAVSPNLGPFRKSLFLATGMLVPATDRRGLGTAKEHPSHA
jgi:hypothetical protein